MTKYKTLAKNTVLLALSQFGTKFISFFFVPLYTYVLSTSDYGYADIITTTASVMMYILTLNISDAVLRFAIDHENDRQNIFVYGIKTVLLGSLASLVFIALIKISGFINWPNHYFVLLFFVYISISISSVCTNYLRAIDKIKEVAIVGILSTIVAIITNLLLLLIWGWGLTGYLTANILSNVSIIIYTLIVISPQKNHYSFKASLKTPLFKEMLVYSIPLILNSLAWWINSSLDKYFVISFCGASENGVYAVSQKIPLILSTVLTVFMQAWNLSAFREYDKDDKDSFFANTYEVFNCVLVITCSGLILFNIPIAKFLFSKEFFVAWKCSSILLLSGVFNGLGNFVGSIFNATKNTKALTYTTLLSAGVNIVLNIILIPRIGIIGAAIATASSFIFFWAIRFILVKRFISWKIEIFKSILTYGLLVSQIVVERVSTHMYAVQVVIFVLVCLINFKKLHIVIKVTLNRFWNKFLSKYGEKLRK